MEILKEAELLFMQQGYHATSTRQIAIRLNVSQPAIYHHFKNKEAIYTEVLTNFAVEVGLRLYEILKKEMPPFETLLAMATYLNHHHPMNLSLMMHDIQHSLTPDAEVKIYEVWKKHYFAPFITFFESIAPTLLPRFTTMTVAQHFLRVLSSYLNDGSKKKLILTLKLMT